VAGTLYLLPTPIADGAAELTLPSATAALARTLNYFLAENAKSARAFLKQIEHPRPLRELTIVEIGHAPDPSMIDAWLQPIVDGADAALVSEAGCPAVADPGATLVAEAHRRAIRVRPLVGPSSLLLALMASGLNGQRFRFCGYLPVAAAERSARIAALERDSRNGETQIFIETPYRSDAMFDALLVTCAAGTRLAVAVDLTGPGEFARMQSIADWRSESPRPQLGRRPAVFCLLA
jgi:16S rRNA (cytidine1402-2'-O)-methyltransferase